MSDGAPREPRRSRWILRIAAALVPGHRRASWRRQWRAELEHRRTSGAGLGGLTAFALGSVWHAAYLRREEVTMRGWLADLRCSARALARNPGFTALTVATLALGVGAATAVFTLAETVLLRPLPLENDDRLVRIHSKDPSSSPW